MPVTEALGYPPVVQDAATVDGARPTTIAEEAIAMTRKHPAFDGPHICA